MALSFLIRSALVFVGIVISTNDLLIAQDRLVTGLVVNAQQEPLAGVSIKLEGSDISTSSDGNGKFSIPLGEPRGQLTVSSVGYVTHTVAVTSGEQIRIELADDMGQLDEVIVLGYGSQSQRKVTGAVQTVKATDLADLPVSQLSQKLQGRLAGVQIQQMNGRPGSGMSVRIRGQASVSAGNQPLYVVDGFPITGDISHINPDEVETITVLKDAASTSLYGSRASNGVVMVTTKRAVAGDVQVGLNAFYGAQTLPNRGRPDMLNAREFAQYMKELHEDNSRAVPDEYLDPSQYGAGTDWFKEITQVAPIQNYSITIGGAGEKFSANGVLGYFDQEGVVINSGFKRFSARLNADYKVNDHIKFGLNVAPMHSIYNGAQTEGGPFTSPNSGLMTSALVASPLIQAVNPDGSMPIVGSSPGMLPTANWYRVAKETDLADKNTSLISSAFVEVSFLQDFTFKSSLNAELGNRFFNQFIPSTSGNMNVALPRASGDLIQQKNAYSTWLSENILTYTKQVDKHHVDVMGGFTAQAYRSDFSDIRATNFANDQVRTLSAATTFVPQSDIQEWRLLSYLGRVNYDFAGKYLVSASIRADGSSRFGVDNRWGTFPSVSLGWVISDEPFMERFRSISFMKLRSSFGVTGNNNIGNYTYFANVSSAGSLTSNNYVFDNQVAQGNNVTTIENRTLGWEITEQFDVGLDISFFNNRLTFGYDYYTKTTDGLLFNVDLPSFTGYSSFQTNIGTFNFRGHEFLVSSKNTAGAFQWNTDLNISFLRNRVEKLGTANAFLGGGTSRNITMVGQPIGMLWGYVHDGVYINQADFDSSPTFQTSAVGSVKMRDINGDGEITVDDRTIIGNPNPNFVFGITNNFAYKAFDLSIVAAGSFGNDIMNTALEYTGNLDGVFNVSRDALHRWRSEQNPGNGLWPSTLAGTTGLFRNSNSLWVTDGSYLAIKNITIGYRLPTSNWTSKLKNLRLYAGVQNAFVFTSYQGFNPEVSTGGDNPLSQGLDQGAYPVPRIVTFGLNMGL